MGGGVISSERVVIPTQVIVSNPDKVLAPCKEIVQPFPRNHQMSVKMLSSQNVSNHVNYFRKVRHGQRRESWKHIS
jgi:hypothetical protein